MLNFLSTIFDTTIRVGLSKTGLAVLRSGSALNQLSVLFHHSISEELLESSEHLSQQLDTIFRNYTCDGLPLAILLSDDLVRLFMVNPPQNAASILDLKAAASMRFQSLYGENINTWHIEADWQMNGAFLACSLPCTILNALEYVSKVRKMPLVAIMPQFIATWNTWYKHLPSNAWLGVIKDNKLTLGAIEHAPQKRLKAIQTFLIKDPSPHLNWLPTYVERAALCWNIPVPSQIQLSGTDYHEKEIKKNPKNTSLSIINLDIKRPSLARLKSPIPSDIFLACSGIRL